MRILPPQLAGVGARSWPGAACAVSLCACVVVTKQDYDNDTVTVVTEKDYKTPICYHA